jgi:tRNA threonylcarbamoyladenosine biosynthesis protein TsaB
LLVRILAADTSSNWGSLCFVEDGEVLGQVSLTGALQHSQNLFESLEFLLARVPLKLADIDIFAAARGPGSFTGLRIGLAAMEGFAAANNRVGIGISTLEALAWKAPVSEGMIAPVIDARRGEVYGALYRRAGDDLAEEVPPAVMSPAQWFASLPDLAINFCGDGAKRYRNLMDRPAWSLLRMDLYLAPSIAELALTPRSGPLEPLYVRRTDAEIARERHHESVRGSNT